MDHSITNTKIPDIIYDYKDHIIKCVETNSPIKRTIRKEIYKWVINEIHEYKNQERCAFICPILKSMYFAIVSIGCPESVYNFSLNNEKQNVFPELNINKIICYAVKT